MKLSFIKLTTVGAVLNCLCHSPYKVCRNRNISDIYHSQKQKPTNILAGILRILGQYNLTSYVASTRDHTLLWHLLPRVSWNLILGFSRVNPFKAAKGKPRKLNIWIQAEKKAGIWGLSHVVPPFSKRRRKTCWNKNTTKEQPFPKPVPIATPTDETRVTSAPSKPLQWTNVRITKVSP